jgi:hypothetical protein
MPTWFVDDPKQSFTPPPARSSASLVILSEELSGKELTELVGLPADEQWNRGDRAHAPGRFAGYMLGSRLAESATPAEHLTDLLDRIGPNAARVRAIVADGRISSVRVWLGHHIPNWNPGLSLSAEHLTRLDKLGAGLEIDIYVTE